MCERPFVRQFGGEIFCGSQGTSTLWTVEGERKKKRKKTTDNSLTGPGGGPGDI